MLNPGDIQAIQRLLQSGRHSVKDNPRWRRISDHFSIGKPVQGTIWFTSADISALHKQMNNQVIGDDILHTPLNGSRTDIAGAFANEKISSRPVFGGWFGGARHPSRPISIGGTATTIPQGTCLAFDYQSLELGSDDRLIIVENGEAFLAADAFDIPTPYKEAIWIYRGHTGNQRGVRNLIKRFNGINEVVGFFDCDPAGICHGLDMGVDALLLPSGWDQHHRSHPVAKDFNKTALFHQQAFGLRHRRPPLSSPASKVIDAILSGEWSLTQEHMAAHRIPLVTIGLGERYHDVE